MGVDGMARQHHTAEEIINKLREAEVGPAIRLTGPEGSIPTGPSRGAHHARRGAPLGGGQE